MKSPKPSLEYVGKILSIHLSKPGLMHIDNVNLKVQWYLKKAETPLANEPYISKSEVFLSNSMEEINVLAVNGRAEIVSLE